MSKVKLEVGMPAKCTVFGECIINELRNPEFSSFPIIIKQSDGNTQTFTKDGRILQTCNPTLKLLNIPFTEGLEVDCLIYGSGAVTHINTDPVKPIGILFDNGAVAYYSTDGRISPSANQTLFPKFTI